MTGFFSLTAGVLLLQLLQTSFGAPAPAPVHVLDDSSLLSQIGAGGGLEQIPLTTQRIPTRYESTVLGRRLLAQSRHGFISTDFPHHISSDRIPHNVHDSPIALPEYLASCEEPSGNPTLLALTVSTSTQNAFAGSNVSLAVSWWDEYVRHTDSEPWSYANLPRLSLIGRIEEISEQDIEAHDIPGCFTRVHADSKWWLPGNKASPHTGIWMRLVVQEIYWIGGFGDRAFIGWFDPEEWRNVTSSEWQQVRLPGEK